MIPSKFGFAAPYHWVVPDNPNTENKTGQQRYACAVDHRNPMGYGYLSEAASANPKRP